MFGFTLIKEKELAELHKRCQFHEMQSERLSAELFKANVKLNDYKTLKESAKKLKEREKNLIAFKRDTLEALSKVTINGQRLVLGYENCDQCSAETPDCKKYVFGETVFCVK